MNHKFWVGLSSIHLESNTKSLQVVDDEYIIQQINGISFIAPPASIRTAYRSRHSPARRSVIGFLQGLAGFESGSSDQVGQGVVEGIMDWVKESGEDLLESGFGKMR